MLDHREQCEATRLGMRGPDCQVYTRECREVVVLGEHVYMCADCLDHAREHMRDHVGVATNRPAYTCDQCGSWVRDRWSVLMVDEGGTRDERAWATFMCEDCFAERYDLVDARLVRDAIESPQTPAFECDHPLVYTATPESNERGYILLTWEELELVGWVGTSTSSRLLASNGADTCRNFARNQRALVRASLERCPEEGRLRML
jgi:hypothetical protein